MEGEARRRAVISGGLARAAQKILYAFTQSFRQKTAESDFKNLSLGFLHIVSDAMEGQAVVIKNGKTCA